MRRWMVLSVFAVVLGAVASQGVAYICAARASEMIASINKAAPGQPLWPSFLRGFCPNPQTASVGMGLGMGHSYSVSESPMPAPPDFRDNPPRFCLVTESFGWPARSLVIYEGILVTNGANGGAIDERRFYKDFQHRAGLGLGVPAPTWMPRIGRLQSAIPVLPLGMGLVVNTVAYGALSLGILITSRTLRRMSRRRRGCCIACGYERAGSAVCPECGLGARPDPS